MKNFQRESFGAFFLVLPNDLFQQLFCII
jgi:hypothetical protein